MAAPWISPPCHPCPSDDALRRLLPGIASAQDGGDGRVKEDARDGGSRALHVAAGRGRMTVCVFLVISMFSDTIPFELPELLAIASSAFHKNMETVKEMSNDEYIQILRDILKRVLAGDGAAANLGLLKNGDSAGGGWSRKSSCARESDGSTTSWSFVTSELEDVQGRDRSSPPSCGAVSHKGREKIT